MSEKVKTMEELRKEIIDKFASIGVAVEEGQPHLRTGSSSYIIPNENNAKKYILK